MPSARSPAATPAPPHPGTLALRCHLCLTFAAMPAHILSLRIHPQDTDAVGIVHHGAYLGFAERGRASRTRKARPCSAARSSGGTPTARRARLRYLRPLRLDDAVALRTGTIRAGGASCGLRQTFWRDDILAVRAEIELACVRIDTGRPARIPPRWRSALDTLWDLPGES